jgi:hypothetical protein
MSVCAGVLCFALAIFIPKFMLGRITMITGGVGGMSGMLRHSGSGGGGGAAGGGTGALERMGQMRAGLLAAGTAGSRGVGHALSSFGPAGVGAGFGLKGLKDSGHLAQLHGSTRSAVGSTRVGKAADAASSGLAGKWGALSDWAQGSSSRTAGAARVSAAMPTAVGTAYRSIQPPAGDRHRGGTPDQGASGGGSGRPGAANRAAAGVRSRASASGAAAKSGRGQDPPPAGWRAAEPIYEAALKGTSAGGNAGAALGNAGAAAEQARRVFIADSQGRVDTPGQQRPGTRKPATPTDTAGPKSTTGHDQMRRMTWGFRNRKS